MPNPKIKPAITVTVLIAFPSDPDFVQPVFEVLETGLDVVLQAFNLFPDVVSLPDQPAHDDTRQGANLKPALDDQAHRATSLRRKRLRMSQATWPNSKPNSPANITTPANASETSQSNWFCVSVTLFIWPSFQSRGAAAGRRSR